MSPKMYGIELLSLMAECKTEHDRILILVAAVKYVAENIDDEGETWEYWNEIGKFILKLKMKNEFR